MFLRRVNNTEPKSQLDETPTKDTSEQHSRKIRPVWFGIVIIAVITFAIVQGGSSFYIFVLDSWLIAIFGAIGLNLVMGTAGQVSIGNSAFLAVGAFAAIFALRSGIAFPLDLVVGTLGAALAGIIIGLPAVRLRGLYLALATLAGFYIVTFLANEYQSRAQGAGSGGFLLTPLYSSKGLIGGEVYWSWTLLVLVAVLMLCATRLDKERSGRAWRMIRDHETVAAALGVRTSSYKITAFAISSGIIGFEGTLMAHFSGSVSVDTFTFAIAVSYIAMVIIGGLDSVAGAVIGAAVVTIIPLIMPNIISGFVSSETAATAGPAFAEIFYGALVVLFVSASPGGIVGLCRKVLGWLKSRKSFSLAFESIHRRKLEKRAQ